MKRALLLTLFTGLVVSGPAMAGVGQGNGEIGFDLGWTNFDSDVADDTGARFTVRGGYHFTPWFELEGQLAGMATTIEDTFVGDIDVSLGTFTINAVFNFRPTPEIVPYVLVGFGQANLDFDAGVSVDDDGNAWQLAAGSRFFFGRTKRTAVRIELSSLREDTFDESSTHNSFVAGLTWRLGR